MALLLDQLLPPPLLPCRHQIFFIGSHMSWVSCFDTGPALGLQKPLPSDRAHPCVLPYPPPPMSPPSSSKPFSFLCFISLHLGKHILPYLNVLMKIGCQTKYLSTQIYYMLFSVVIIETEDFNVQLCHLLMFVNSIGIFLAQFDLI